MPRAPRLAPLSIRLSTEDRAILTSRAEQAGLSVGGYFRMAALDAPVPRRHPIDRDLLIRILAELGSVRGNTNQLAYVANTGGWPESRAIAGAIEDIHAMRDALLLALGRTPPPVPAAGDPPAPAP